MYGCHFHFDGNVDAPATWEDGVFLLGVVSDSGINQTQYNTYSVNERTHRNTEWKHGKGFQLTAASKVTPM